MPGVIETSYSFTNNDTITSAKMNNIIDETTFVSTAISGTTLQIVSGKLAVNSLGITSNELSTNSVTVGKITDACVTPAKLSVGRPDWNDWTADANKVSTFILGYNRGASQSGATNLYFESSDGIVNAVDAIISREAGTNGQMSIENLHDPADTTDTRGQINFGINSVVKMSIKQDGKILIGTYELFGPKAWVNFDGVTAGTFAGGGSTVTRNAGLTLCTVTTASNHNLITGNKVYAATGVLAGAYTITKLTDKTFTFNTVATTLLTAVAITFSVKTILGSGNVNSIAYLGNGAYAVNLSQALADANYAVSISCKSAGTYQLNGYQKTADEKTTSMFSFFTSDDSGTFHDAKEVSVMIIQ